MTHMTSHALNEAATAKQQGYVKHLVNVQAWVMGCKSRTEPHTCIEQKQQVPTHEISILNFQIT